MDNKMRAIIIQLGASYELAGRKLTDDTLLGAAKEIYDTIEINEDEVQKLFRKARTIADIPTIRVLNTRYSRRPWRNGRSRCSSASCRATCR